MGTTDYFDFTLAEDTTTEGVESFNIQLNNGPDAGQEVPHVHFHIIPRPEGLLVPKLGKYADGQMAEVGARIRACLDS